MGLKLLLTPSDWGLRLDENKPQPCSLFGFLDVFSFFIPGWILSSNTIVVSQLNEPHKSFKDVLVSVFYVYERSICLHDRSGHQAEESIRSQCSNH